MRRVVRKKRKYAKSSASRGKALIWFKLDNCLRPKEVKLKINLKNKNKKQICVYVERVELIFL